MNGTSRWIRVALALPVAVAILTGGVLADDEVAAQVGDLKITMTDLDDVARAANAQAYQALYDARRQALDQIIEKHLLEKEAGTRGISVSQLLQTAYLFLAVLQVVRTPDERLYGITHNKEMINIVFKIYLSCNQPYFFSVFWNPKLRFNPHFPTPHSPLR